MEFHEIIKSYRDLRERKADLIKQQADLIGKIQKVLDALSIEGLKWLDDHKSTSQKTEFGTGARKRTSSLTTPDKFAFKQFCIEKQQLDLMDAKPVKKNIDIYIKDVGDLPPGLKYSAFYTLSVTKPSKKSKDLGD